MASSCTRKTNRRTAIEDLLKVEVLNGKDSHWVSGWSDADTLFIAIPSYACDDSLKVRAERLSVYDPIIGNETVAFVKPDGIYQVKGQRRFVLKVMKSASVATVYIDTESGSDAYINQDKSNREGCDLLVVDCNGEIAYSSDVFECTIKGRGNTSWRLTDKKSYQVKLPKKASLLGMNPAKKWVFLANAFDRTNLRNKIVFEFGRKLDIGFVPDSRYADVFINEKYYGLYLITEKVEYKKNRVYVEDCDSVFLLHQTSESTGNGLPDCFVTDHAQIIAIDYPDISDQCIATAKQLVLEMEQMILEEQNLDFQRCFDMRSWACKYLVDDIFENTDCNYRSSYFYVVCTNGAVKYCAGPLWDYDRGAGNNMCNRAPDMFLARRSWKKKNAYTPYYQALIDKPEFFDVVCELYRGTLRPLLDSLVYAGGISSIEAEIRQSSWVNSQKYRATNEHIDKALLVDNLDKLVAHLEKRIELLDKIYIDLAPHVLVSYEIINRKNFYCYKTIPKGEKLDRTMLVGAEQNPDVVWALKGTDQPFDFSRELTEDIVLDILEK